MKYRASRGEGLVRPADEPCLGAVGGAIPGKNQYKIAVLEWRWEGLEKVFLWRCMFRPMKYRASCAEGLGSHEGLRELGATDGHYPW